MKRDSVHRHLPFQQEHNKYRAGPGVQGKEWAVITEPRWKKMSGLCKSWEAELTAVPSQAAGATFSHSDRGEKLEVSLLDHFLLGAAALLSFFLKYFY